MPRSSLSDAEWHPGLGRRCHSEMPEVVEREMCWNTRLAPSIRVPGVSPVDGRANDPLAKPAPQNPSLRTEEHEFGGISGRAAAVSSEVGRKGVCQKRGNCQGPETGARFASGLDALDGRRVP